MELKSKQIIDLFKQFKLGNSLFKTEYHFSKDSFNELAKNSQTEIVKRECANRLADYIITNHFSCIKEEETKSLGHEIYFRAELLVLKQSDFKLIVEAAIQMIPIEKLIELRNDKHTNYSIIC